MTPVAAPSIVKTERFPFLSHRTCAEIDREPGDLFCTPDRVSSVPIIEGPLGTSDCWEFRFIIPGDGR